MFTQAVATQGKAGFYEGRIAQAIVDILPNYDGVMSVDDLRNHTSAFDTPASVDYRGHTVWEMPPNCQGIIALMILNILEGFDLEGCIISQTAIS